MHNFTQKPVNLPDYMKRWLKVQKIKRLRKNYNSSKYKAIDVMKLNHGSVVINGYRSKFVFMHTCPRNSNMAFVRIGTQVIVVNKTDLHWKAAIRLRRASRQPL